jgi:hypothetical protein
MLWALLGEVFGFVSSILLAFGFSTPAGVVMFVTNAVPAKQRERSALWLKWFARIGFGLLALSFAIQAGVTLGWVS